jgi:protein-S-isoprenylcysteine O-methyltransferase Ste14
MSRAEGPSETCGSTSWRIEREPRRGESFPGGQIQDPQRTWAHRPYRFVRHPLYAARIVLITGAALTFGSWIALIPAALNAVLLILRTSLEDRLLTTKLPGYREYATRVPARLVPGVW